MDPFMGNGDGHESHDDGKGWLLTILLLGDRFGAMGLYDSLLGCWVRIPTWFQIMSIGMGVGWGNRFMRPCMGFYDPFWGPGFGFPSWLRRSLWRLVVGVELFIIQ